MWGFRDLAPKQCVRGANLKGKRGSVDGARV